MDYFFEVEESEERFFKLTAYRLRLVEALLRERGLPVPEFEILSLQELANVVSMIEALLHIAPPRK